MYASWLSGLSMLGIGFVFGVKHALDADHLAAISTIVSQRRSLLQSSVIGGLWGVGHTVSLLTAAIVVIVLQVQISDGVARLLETGVAVMLIGLGLNALRRLVSAERVHVHIHQHGDRVHVHPHVHAAGTDAHAHAAGTSHHRVGFAARPIVVGMVHGMAGSAALTLLVLTTIPTTLGRLAYIVAFGIGSIGGMLIMSALIGLPAHLTAGRYRRAHLAVQTLAALFSLGLGCVMAYQLQVGA